MAAEITSLTKEQALQALQESEQRYRELVQNANSAIIRWKSDGSITFFNEYAQTFFGYSEKEIIGQPVSILVPETESTGASLTSLVQDIINHPERYVQNINENIRRDGSRVWMVWTNKPVFDEAGKVIEILTVGNDITDRKKAEEEISRLAQFPEENPNPVLRSTPGGEILYANTPARQWLATMGWRIGGLLPAPVFAAIAEAQGKNKTIQTEITDPTGQTMSVTAVQPSSGYYINLYGINITDRKQAETERIKSEDRFKLLSDTAGRLLASDNPQDLVNELCRKVMEHLDCQAFFNFLLDEKVGRLRLNAYTGIPEEEAMKIKWLDLGVAVCGCVAQEGCRIIAEDIFHIPDPRTELVKSYGIQAYACHPLMTGGKVIGTLSFGTSTRARFSSEDIDLMKTVANHVATAMEKMRLIAELRHSRDELEQRVQERTVELEFKNQELQDFAFAASHDLREPLRKVITFGERLKMKYGEVMGEAGADYLKRMLNATIRMRSLLNSLLEYSGITTKIESFQETNLGGIIREVISDLELRIENCGGIVEMDDLPVISADPAQMRQLFQNLIENGLKFQQGDKQPVIKVSTVKVDQDNVRIMVEDNGIGFDEVYLNKIFSPFQRLNGRNDYEGTGMGLAICKKIIERHGGSISAQSLPGQGSKFMVILPNQSEMAYK